MSGGGPAVEVPRAVDVVAVQAEPLVTVEPVNARLVDLEPDPEPAEAEQSPPGPVGLPAPPEPPEVTAADSDGTAGPTARQMSRWTTPSPGTGISFCFNLAKLRGQGEDADPILQVAPELGLVAVFDGMGGAGGTTYSTDEGPRTGAYLASRVARDVVDPLMVDLLSADSDLDGPSVAQSLHDSIEGALRTRLIQLQAPRSSLRSKLLRALPTTMAMAALTRHATVEDQWKCHLLWAGDSRVYVLRPGSGTGQLTTDDIRDQGDALANLRQDSVISNAMSADTAFVVNHRMVDLNTPFLVIAATDGCYGYLPSPMHFEWLVLSTLRDATDPEGWAELLQNQIAAISGDDASMAVLGIGTDHRGFQTLFAERTDTLQDRWVIPLDQMDAEVTDLERRFLDSRRRQAEHTAELWATYRPDYEQYTATATVARGEETS